MSNNPFFPYATTNAAGSFSVESNGFIAGTAYNSPNARFNHAMGILAASETLPIYGGVPIIENVPQFGSRGSVLQRATSVGQIGGFTVFDQAYSWVSSPQSPCPSAGAGMSVPFYRLGSGARIAVPCDPSISGLVGSPVNAGVGWDFGAGTLVVAVSSSSSISSITLAQGSTAPYTLQVTPATPLSNAVVGETITISGVTGTQAQYINGTWPITANNSGVLSVQIPQLPSGLGGNLDYSGATMVLSVGSLSVRVLDIDIGNSKVPVLDPTTGAVTWNNSGSAAVILL